MMTKPRLATRLAACATLIALIGSAVAADLGSGNESGPDPLAAAREHVAAKRWGPALDELKRVNLPDSADWNNLMGFASRKQPAPDLTAAERFYDVALRINPKHRGALEYSGELYLTKGDLKRAEERLHALDKACLLPCDEHRTLRKAVESYKSNGGRQVQSSY